MRAIASTSRRASIRCSPLKEPAMLKMQKIIVVALVALAGAASAQERHDRGDHDRDGPRAQMRYDSRYHHDRYYPRPGYVVPALPRGSVRIAYRGGSYFFHGGVWYRPSGARFVVVRRRSASSAGPAAGLRHAAHRRRAVLLRRWRLLRVAPGAAGYVGRRATAGRRYGAADRRSPRPGARRRRRSRSSIRATARAPAQTEADRRECNRGPRRSPTRSPTPMCSSAPSPPAWTAAATRCAERQWPASPGAMRRGSAPRAGPHSRYRAHSLPMAPRIHFDHPLQPGDSWRCRAAQTRHAQVLRLQPGDAADRCSTARRRVARQVARMGRPTSTCGSRARRRRPRTAVRDHAGGRHAGQRAHGRADREGHRARRRGDPAAAVRALGAAAGGERAEKRVSTGRRWRSAPASKRPHARAAVAPVRTLATGCAAAAAPTSGAATLRAEPAARRPGRLAAQVDAAPLLFLSGPEGGLDARRGSAGGARGFARVSLGPARAARRHRAAGGARVVRPGRAARRLSTRGEQLLASPAVPAPSREPACRSR